MIVINENIARMIENHTQDERLNGICRVCTLTTEQIKKCFAYGMVGDRGCDSRHIPGYEEGMEYNICIYNKNKN
jgi:hypothetical protein